VFGKKMCRKFVSRTKYSCPFFYCCTAYGKCKEKVYLFFSLLYGKINRQVILNYDSFNKHWRVLLFNVSFNGLFICSYEVHQCGHYMYILIKFINVVILCTNGLGAVLDWLKQRSPFAIFCRLLTNHFCRKKWR